MPRAAALNPTMAPLVLSGLAPLLAVVAVPLAAAHQDSAADLSAFSALGWALGVAGVLAFTWFRARHLAGSNSPDHAVLRWHPHRLAVAFGAVSWLVSLYHAYVIADALARQ